MTLDESVYTQPNEFMPERFLPKPLGNGEPFPPIFGWGRRYVIYVSALVTVINQLLASVLVDISEMEFFGLLLQPSWRQLQSRRSLTNQARR